MTKFKDRSLAISLRNEGKTYREIRSKVQVSKSTLSLWLRKIPLTEDQMQRIRDIRERAIERFRETMRRKRERRLLGYYKTQLKLWLPLSERELFLSGLFLYWGEGSKASFHTISISNTDPTLLIFGLTWMTKALKIPKNSIKACLQLYSDMDVDESVDFWSNELRISKSQFNKSYIKKSTRSSVDQKGFGKGTCTIIAQNTVIKENILMAIKSIADFYSKSAKV